MTSIDTAPGTDQPQTGIRASRRGFALGMAGIGGLMAAGLATGSAGAATKAAAEPRIKNVVLVHGFYADGSCWSDVIGRLQQKGLNVRAVQNPLTTLADDVAATRRILDLQDGPTVLVGHSWGGMVISEAGIHPKVASLVYVAARAPDAGEDWAALGARYPKAPAAAGLIHADGHAWLSEEAFLKDFAGDVDPARARILFATQGQISDTISSSVTTQAAWRSKPTSYVVATKDRTIPPELQRFVAARMKAQTIEVPSSHVAMISHPKEVSDLILEATTRRA